MRRRNALRAGAGTLLAAACVSWSWAQVPAFPTRPVQVIVPIGPGTEVDWIARRYAQKLWELWGQPVTVENRLGVGGDIGIGYAAKAPADGHTILFTGGSFAINPLINKSSYDPLHSFKPVMLTGLSYFSLTVSSKMSATSFKDFIAEVKSKPGHYNYASPGNGTVQHLTMELLKKELDLNLTHVPYKSAGAAVTDLASGTVDVAIVSTPQVVEMERGGRVRILVLLSPDRETLVPHVPQAVELGFPRLVVTGWSAAMVPAGTPEGIVQKINRDMNNVRQNSDLMEAFQKRSGRPDTAGGSTERLAELIRSDLTRWKQVVAAANIRPD